MGKTSDLCIVLGELSIFHYVRAEPRRARELAEEAINQARRTRDPLLVASGHWYLGIVLFCLGEYEAAQAHLAQTISFYEPQKHHEPLLSLRGSDAGVSALAYYACCLWCLGYPEQAMKRGREALAVARDLGHAFSLADVICFAGCMLHRMRRDALALKDSADELVQIAIGEGISGWLATGTCYRGEGMVLLGQTSEGMAQLRGHGE
jgi:tetratricopeptide (TPR) repeat protein